MNQSYIKSQWMAWVLRASHEYQRLQLPITEHIIQHRLGDFRDYVTALLKR